MIVLEKYRKIVGILTNINACTLFVYGDCMYELISYLIMGGGVFRKQYITAHKRPYRCIMSLALLRAYFLW